MDNPAFPRFEESISQLMAGSTFPLNWQPGAAGKARFLTAADNQVQAARVLHTLDGSWNDLWTGTTETRLLSFEEDGLVYTTPETIDPMDGQRCTYRVEFERA